MQPLASAHIPWLPYVPFDVVSETLTLVLTGRPPTVTQLSAVPSLVSVPLPFARRTLPPLTLLVALDLGFLPAPMSFTETTSGSPLAKTVPLMIHTVGVLEVLPPPMPAASAPPVAVTLALLM